MAVGVETAFLIIGGLIVIGYLGELLSRRFTLPTALLLLGIGFGLKVSGLVNDQDFTGLQNFFGTLALIFLLFDGALSLNIFEVLFKSGRVIAVAGGIILLSMLGTAGMFMLFGMDPLIGAILGAIIGGIDTGVTLSMTRVMTLPDEIQRFLTLESSITDVFSIILAIVLTQALLSGIINPLFIAQGIVGKFAIGIFLGLLSGVASILLLSHIEKGYNYMVTFAIVLIVYSLTEFLGGSGAISVLAFGVILGNEMAVRRVIHSREVESRPMIQQFQSEISFFIRTFFFVFLGIVVAVGNTRNFAIAFLLIILLYLARYLVVKASTRNSQYADYSGVLTAINPRGLATAVLVTYPLVVVQNAIANGQNGHMSSLVPQLASLSEIAFYLIILSIIFTTILLPLASGKEKKKEGKELRGLEQIRLEGKNTQKKANQAI
ncbi:MAG: cation:proton antiporter [archaeon]